MHEALRVALPDASFAERRFDCAIFCDFDDFDALAPEMRARIAVTDEEVDELAGCDVVSGHFTLPTLLRIAEPASIATVLREPRARLLSLYAYWRSEDFRAWAPYAAHVHARRPLEEFLAEPALAAATDNKLVRLLLADDPLIPVRGFIADEAVPALAERALERLAELGFVGVQELDEHMWAGLSRAFGCDLDSRHVNATVSAPATPAEAAARRDDGDSAPSDRPLVTPAALELLEQRTRISRRVYRAIAARILGSERAARQLTDAAFRDQLARFERWGSRRLGRSGSPRPTQLRQSAAMPALTPHMPPEAAGMPNPGDNLISRVVGAPDHTWFYWTGRESVRELERTLASARRCCARSGPTARIRTASTMRASARSSGWRARSRRATPACASWSASSSAPESGGGLLPAWRGTVRAGRLVASAAMVRSERRSSGRASRDARAPARRGRSPAVGRAACPART